MKKSNTLHLQIIVCGVGGQGVLFLTRILNDAAIFLGQDVISSETHGMAIRGGSVVSYIRIGEFKSPLIRASQADIAMALAENELILYRHLFKKDCQIYVNKSRGRNYHSVNANRIAEDLGTPLVANLVLLGFAAGHKEFPIDQQVLKSVLQNISPAKTLVFNLKALEEGYRIAQAIPQSNNFR